MTRKHLGNTHQGVKGHLCSHSVVRTEIGLLSCPAWSMAATQHTGSRKSRDATFNLLYLRGLNVNDIYFWIMADHDNSALSFFFFVGMQLVI